MFFLKFAKTSSMKTLLPDVMEGLISLFSTLTVGKETFFSRNSFINEDFFDQFNNDKDRELLNRTVSELKNSNQKSREITLSNAKRIKIVVD